MYPQAHPNFGNGAIEYQDFSFEAPANGPDYSALRSPLLHKGEDTGVEIQGIVLDHQFCLPDGFLLLSSWDCPFEEACEVSLLSPEMKLISHKSIGAMYSSYELDSIESVGENAFRLQFTHGATYSLAVRTKKRLPFGSRLALSRTP